MEIIHRAEMDNLSFCGTCTVRTGIIEPHATCRTLELLLLVWSDTFFFFSLSQARSEGVSFRCALALLCKRGNFGRRSARFNYSCSYGIQKRCVDMYKTVEPHVLAECRYVRNISRMSCGK